MIFINNDTTFFFVFSIFVAVVVPVAGAKSEQKDAQSK